MRLGKLGKELKKQLDRALSEETVNSLCDSTYDSKFGARPAKPAVADYIDDILMSSLEHGFRGDRSINTQPEKNRRQVSRLKLNVLETEREKDVSW